MAAKFQVGADGVPRLGAAQRIVEFQGTTVVPQANIFAYSAHPDGKRFLVYVFPPDRSPGINLISNWQKLANTGNR